MNHKRGKSKAQRAGCLMCKWYKHPGAKGMLKAQRMQERKARVTEAEA
jgi:hypothetical protein